MKQMRPVLFVPHGSPMFALQPGAAGAAMAAVTAGMERPRAILVISPHWETDVPTVGTATRLATMHDFHGFDPRLYEIRYPATGCPEAAREVLDTLVTHGFQALTDAQRGLDHGAWVPLRQMFPDADVPVVPLSIQHQGGPRHAYRIGQALAPLGNRGFLIIASGNITHNLHDWHAARTGSPVDAAYVVRFANWIHQTITSGDVAALLDYRRHSADGQWAHPRDEHLIPLFTALGAAGDAAHAEAFHRSISERVIAMDGYRFH
jgi:4,5-DOPA dioxygenase extradiol